jgi:rhodanese-related sulfurtransferase
MTVHTQDKTQEAVKHFESKLAFEIGPIGLHYAQKANEPLQIIDLRTKEYFEKGHVPGAVNVSIEELEQYASKLSKDKTTIVYCYDLLCNLAAKGALTLAKKGFPVKELIGGYDEWAATDAKIQAKSKGSSCTTSSCG